MKAVAPHVFMWRHAHACSSHTPKLMPHKVRDVFKITVRRCTMYVALWVLARSYSITFVLISGPPTRVGVEPKAQWPTPGPPARAPLATKPASGAIESPAMCVPPHHN